MIVVASLACFFGVCIAWNIADALWAIARALQEVANATKGQSANGEIKMCSTSYDSSASWAYRNRPR
jgi:4-hydroxyphenylpyruvate dioxygenase-like putative hemolysin